MIGDPQIFNVLPLRQDVGDLYVECLHWYQRPFARWLWVWPHGVTPEQFRRGQQDPVIVQRGYETPARASRDRTSLRLHMARCGYSTAELAEMGL